MDFTYWKALKFMRIWRRLCDDALDFVFVERIMFVFVCGEDVRIFEIDRNCLRRGLWIRVFD